jgi:hypothetical protein
MMRVGLDELLTTQEASYEDSESAYAARGESLMKPSKITSNIFLGDIRASTHMGYSDEGMFDVTVISSPVKIGNGVVLMVTKIGKQRMTSMQTNGENIDLVLEGYKHVPELWVNLFSITKSLSKGLNIGNKGGIQLFISKGNAKLVFDRVFQTRKGMVVGIEMVPITSNATHGMAASALERGKTLNTNVLH